MKKRYRLNDIKLPIGGYSLESVKTKAAVMLRVEAGVISKAKLVGKAVDARDKRDIRYVSSLEFGLELTGDRLKRVVERGKLTECEEYSYENPYKLLRLGANTGIIESGEFKKIEVSSRPVVVGCGPAGLFAALVLAESGLSPIVVERGKPVGDRAEDAERLFSSGMLDTESNVLFGEGGAGAFSDGKLQSGIKDKRVAKVLREFADAGAGDEILYSAKPHIGTDVLREVIVNLRRKIESMGGEFRFGTKLMGFETEEGAVRALELQCDGRSCRLQADRVILAIGHSARDTTEMLLQAGIKMLPKPFSVGLRIEHTREFIDRSQYGSFADKLPSAEYKLSAKASNGRGVYSFCMCPGGFVIPAVNEAGRLAVNGMSNRARDAENSNSALLVSVSPEDFPGPAPLGGFELQRGIEERAYALGGGGFAAPVTLLGDYLEGGASGSIGAVKPSYRPGYKLCDIAACLPDYVNESLRSAIREFGKKIRGFDCGDAVLTAAETRSSSPVRFVRNESGESGVAGVYPAGEGGGFAGGITSSAVDGIKAAETVTRSL